jgi:glycine/D-amino acid oxidase-like deaminating enzyme
MTNYSAISYWHASAGPIEPRAPLPGPADCDVCIVGAGFTGLWTAYYLSKADPHLRIVVLEKEITGFGASGRNGGWSSSLFAASWSTIARQSSRAAAIALQREMFHTVDEVGRVTASEGIEAEFVKGGSLEVVTAAPQFKRIYDTIAEARFWGFGEEDYRWLGPAEVQQRLKLDHCLGGTFTPHCACLHPFRLARGLADVVSRQGVKVYEQTPALSIEPGGVRTPAGFVKAGVVVRATEAYTAGLPGMHRDLIPLYSLMIATEPLGQSVWDEIGWHNRETFNDGRFLLFYAMRTKDGRIAIGGRGAPYHWGSTITAEHDRVPSVHQGLRDVLASLFPVLRGVPIAYEWGGTLGVPRDWFSSVGYDKARGYAWAGGYVGDGVSTTNLAGRTLADLIQGRASEITRLPWVNHVSPRWEPEPLRWLGINLALKAMASADRAEARTGRESRRADLTKRLIGA